MSQDVGRKLTRLCLSELRGRWTHLAIDSVDDRGAVPRCPHAFHPRHRHVRVDHQPAAVLHRWYGLEQRVRLGTNRADDGAAREYFPRFELYVTIGNTQS